MSTFHVYDLHRNWRKFRPHLANPRVQLIEQLAMSAICPEYTVGVHIPREVGGCLDVPWPRSRKGATAYQCFGHCHAIAPVMLELARLAEPGIEWEILGHRAHTVVVGFRSQSETMILLDVNLAGDTDTATVAYYRSKIQGPINADPGSGFSSVDADSFVEEHLRAGSAFQFRSEWPMRDAQNRLVPGGSGFRPLMIRCVADLDCYTHHQDSDRIARVVVYAEHLMITWCDHAVSTVSIESFITELVLGEDEREALAEDGIDPDTVRVTTPADACFGQPLILDHGQTLAFLGFEVPAARLCELSVLTRRS